MVLLDGLWNCVVEHASQGASAWGEGYTEISRMLIFLVVRGLESNQLSSSKVRHFGIFKDFEKTGNHCLAMTAGELRE